MNLKNIEQTKANIVTPHVRMLRKPKPGNPNMFETDTRSICKLVDGMSQGKILDYVSWRSFNVGYLIRGTISLRQMCRYLLSILSSEQIRLIFGDKIFVDDKDMYEYLINGSALDTTRITRDIEDFIKEKYDYRDMERAWIRRDMTYKNY